MTSVWLGSAEAQAATVGPKVVTAAENLNGAKGQTTSPREPSATIQEIVVTATRRAVDLQKVAATVEAVPASTLKTFDITSVLQLKDVVPGLEIVPVGGNNLYLRGVGTTSAGYNETQVAVYIDGIYLSNPALGIYSFNNIEQIEVLKGPQGTLYGRNATAGLIAVTTRDPGRIPSIDVAAGYGNYDTTTLSLYGAMPVSDTLGANVSVYHSKQNRGWGTNTFNGHGIEKSNETGLQAKVVWQPTTSTKITSSFIYDTNDRDTGVAFQPIPGTIGGDGTVYTGKYRVSSRVDANAPFTA